MNKSLSSLSALLAACALHACNADATDQANDNDDADMAPNDTDTGNAPGGNNDTTNAEGTFGGGCDAEETALDPSATTALGFTAQSVLDLVLGEHTQSLAWLDGDLEYGPESGRSEITLSITAAGAPTLVDREPRAAQNGSGDTLALADIPVYCTDSIRVKVNVAVTTAGGALDEVVTGVFEAHAGDFASGRLSFDLEG